MKSLLYLVSSLFLGIFYTPSSEHDIHVSMCDIKWNTSTESLQISIRIFLDDFESSLAQDGHRDLKILTEKESNKADSLILAYLYKHLELEADGELIKGEFIGKELSEDFLGMWCYLEIPGLTEIKNLKVRNDILLELYDDQQNILSVKKDRKRKGHTIFSQDKTTEIFQL